MKFEDPYQTIAAGFATTLVLIVVWLGMTDGMPDAGSWIEQIFRWTHFLAGITWIGLLYFFNLINARLYEVAGRSSKRGRGAALDAEHALVVPTWRDRDRPCRSRAHIHVAPASVRHGR